MSKKISEFLKKLYNTQGKKKIIENTVIVIIVGMIILIAGSSIFKPGRSDTKSSVENKSSEIEAASKVTSKETSENKSVEEKIEAILSQIEGVGKVDVMITYVSDGEIVPAVNTKINENDTDEKDSGGGTRKIRERDQETSIAYEEAQGTKKPIILTHKEPEVKGVIVVAEGGNDVIVKDKICKAVQVLLDVPIHKVQVFERKK